MVSYMSFQNGKPVGAPKDVVTGFASSDQKGREPVTWTCGGRDLLSLHHLPVVRRRDVAIVRLAATFAITFGASHRAKSMVGNGDHKPHPFAQ